MSNTYFKIQKETDRKDLSGKTEYTDKMNITLTAFVGGEESIQLTVQQEPSKWKGITFITLTNEEATNLANALMERVNGEITATGYEKSKYCDPEIID
jgi:hypothetical protein